MTTDSEIASIIAGLTKAQKNRLLNVAALRKKGKTWTHLDGSLYVSTSKNPSLVLEEKGLLICRNRKFARSGRMVDWGTSDVTDIGHIVVAALEQEKERG